MYEKFTEKIESEKTCSLGLAGSEPCKPTTSARFSPTHFVRRRETKTCVVPVRFTPDERDDLKTKAKESRISLSEYIRRSALKRRLPRPPVSDINIKSYQQLCRVGNNLNQLIKATHEGKARQFDHGILQKLLSAVQQVGFDVLGEGSFDS